MGGVTQGSCSALASKEASTPGGDDSSKSSDLAAVLGTDSAVTEPHPPRGGGVALEHVQEVLDRGERGELAKSSEPCQTRVLPLYHGDGGGFSLAKSLEASKEFSLGKSVEPSGDDTLGTSIESCGGFPVVRPCGGFSLAASLEPFALGSPLTRSVIRPHTLPHAPIMITSRTLLPPPGAEGLFRAQEEQVFRTQSLPSGRRDSGGGGGGVVSPAASLEEGREGLLAPVARKRCANPKP